MSKNYTKYTVEGLGENLNKRKLVFTLVKDWVEKKNLVLRSYNRLFLMKYKAQKALFEKNLKSKIPNVLICVNH